MYTVYTYWNADGVMAVLNAIVLIMGGDSYLGLMRTLAIAGMLVAAGIGLTKISAKEPLQYFIFLGLFYFGLFVPKVTVDVVDVKTGAVGTVANVPFGVAFFYSAESHIGKFLTETFETNFQPVDNLRFQTTGMAFGARAFQETASARAGDPKLQDALREFTRACINPEVIDDPNKYKDLVNSTDIYTTLSGGWVNPARTGTFPDQFAAGYAYVPCDVELTALNTWLIAESQNQLNIIATRLNSDKGASTATWAPAIAAIGGQLADAEAYMLNTSRTALQQIQQGMLANAMNDSSATLAVARNDPSAMQAALAAKMAEMQANSAYRTMGLIGEAALPKFRNIVEIVVYSVFPIVMLLIILGGEKGGAILKTYLLTGVWVQLWAPLYAIINFMMQEGMANRLQAAAAGAASQTMSNTAELTLTAFKEASLAGSLVFAVPLIAYALVKGGEVAMSGALSGLTGTASGAASQQGGSVGVGNIQAGVTSWGNHSSNSMSANKWDTSGSFSQGGWTQRNGDGGFRGDLGGSAGGSGSNMGVADMSARSGNLGPWTAGLSGAIGSSIQSQYQSSVSSGREATSSMVSSIQSAFGLSQGSRHTSGSSSDVSSQWGNGTQTQNGASFDKSFSDAIKYGDTLGLNRGETVALTAAAGVSSKAFLDAVGNMSKGEQSSSAMKALGKAVSAQGDSSFQASSGLRQVFDSARDASSTEAFKGGLKNVMSHSSGTSAGSTSKAGSEQERGARSSYDDVVAAQNSARASYAAAESYADMQSKMSSGGGAYALDLANKFTASLGGPNGAEQFTRSGNEAAKAAQIARFVQSEAVSVGGGFAPSSGATGHAGGEAGARVSSGAQAATRTGAPPNLTSAQADEVQSHHSASNKAAGGVPRATPGTVPGPEGSPVSTGDVVKGSIVGQALDRAAIGAAGARTQGNFEASGDTATGAIRDAAQPGAAAAQGVKALVGALYDDTLGSGLVGEALSAGAKAVTGSPIQRGSALIRTPRAAPPPPTWKDR